jgi:hypothetical protein
LLKFLLDQIKLFLTLAYVLNDLVQFFCHIFLIYKLNWNIWI